VLLVYALLCNRYAHTYEQFLKMSAGLGLVFVRLFSFSILCFFSGLAENTLFLCALPLRYYGNHSKH